MKSKFRPRNKIVRPANDLKAINQLKLITVNENIASLSSCITLANSIKVTMNLHYADITEHTSGADTAIATADAVDYVTLIALTTDMMASYVLHDDDAILGAAWAYHVAQGTEKAPASEVAPTNLTTAIARLNDLKAKLNDHMDDAAAHTDGDSAQEAATDAAVGASVRIVDAEVTAADVVMVTILNNGTGNVEIVSITEGSGYFDVEFSADPQDDTKISYQVYVLIYLLVLYNHQPQLFYQI